MLARLARRAMNGLATLSWGWALWLVAGLVAKLPAAGPAWHDALYADGGGWWYGRVRVVIRNRSDRDARGHPVAVPIGPDEGQAALGGKRAEAIRVCNARGEELLFDVRDGQGELVKEGPIPPGSTLVVPADCPAGGEAAVWVYFDNPTAWPVPDFLERYPGVVNGDLELGEGDQPLGWRHDPPDATHRASWAAENPQSGQRCLKTVVARGAEPTWIATRQAGIAVIGGARYRMRAWVRAEDVRGFAGWYIHIGNDDNPMLIAPMLSGGGGTYGWRQVEAEFTAPVEATRADLGTVLRGTGTAWFDNVTLQCVEPGPLQVTCEKPERVQLEAVGNGAEWIPAPDGPGSSWDGRAVVRVANLGDRPLGPALVVVGLERLRAHWHGPVDPDRLVVTLRGEAIPHFLADERLVFQASLPPRSICTYYVYFSRSFEMATKRRWDYAALVASPANRVANPSFERGQNEPEGWSSTGAGPGIKLGLDTAAPRGLGRRAARLKVDADRSDAWRGWRQSVRVEPGRRYWFSAWVKCHDVPDGQLRVHAHRRTGRGQLSRQQPMVSIGPSLGGTVGWTLLSGVISMPQDTEIFEVHLTMNTSGTVWHDGVVVAEALPGRLVRLEAPPPADPDGIAVWQVPAVEKVFPDTIPPRKSGPVAIAAARNEWEPLQLGLRSHRRKVEVAVRVEPPRGPGDRRLDRFEVNRCGYVPVDYPTNYYRYEGPVWKRKIPTQPPGSDGWPGWWPDPLLPEAKVVLRPQHTEAIWITFRIGRAVRPGDYHGRVLLVDSNTGRTLAEVPFTVHIWNFTLSDRSDLAAIYDVRLGPGGEWWGEPFAMAYRKIVPFMAQRRLCADTIRPAPQFRMEKGRPVIDLREFDRAAEWYFDRFGLPVAYTPWQFYLFGWGHPPKTLFGQRPYPGQAPYEGADRSRLRAEYKRAYQAVLGEFWKHMKERGWDKRMVLYISDEPFAQHEHIRKQMQALCDMIHEVDAEIPIYSSTWRYVEDWVGYLDVWGIGHQGRTSVEEMRQLRKAGARLWFTTDGQMCLDTPYCAVERLLPYYCFKYDVEAYEFWGVSWLTNNPYRFGWHSFIRQSSEPGRSYWVRYPNGDGFLIYPGKPIGYDGLVSSVRLEQAREGLEDFQYLRRLSELIARSGGEGRKSAERAAAQKALDRAMRLVSIPNPGGRYSTRILPDPKHLYAVRRQVAEAIEGLIAR